MSVHLNEHPGILGSFEAPRRPRVDEAQQHQFAPTDLPEPVVPPPRGEASSPGPRRGLAIDGLTERHR